MRRRKVRLGTGSVSQWLGGAPDPTHGARNMGSTPELKDRQQEREQPSPERGYFGKVHERAGRDRRSARLGRRGRSFGQRCSPLSDPAPCSHTGPKRNLTRSESRTTRDFTEGGHKGGAGAGSCGQSSNAGITKSMRSAPTRSKTKDVPSRVGRSAMLASERV